MKDAYDNPQAHLLRCHLAALVPLTIQEVLLGQRFLVFPRPDLAGIIAAHGDAMLYRIPGQTARAVSALVEALATLAFAPGGVSFLDLHFEVPPRQALAVLEAQGLLRALPSARPVILSKPGPAAVDIPLPTFETIFRRQPGSAGTAQGRETNGQA
jgi:hypothetical protein